ncbi:MAG: hypothetical protein IPN74_18135 [Haliscomenobacter sp.]|nr:hypothetical protein [Haliscomenobacter sp.]
MRNYPAVLAALLFVPFGMLHAQADWLALPNPTNIITICPGGNAVGSLLVGDFGSNGAPTDVSFSSSSTDITVIGIPPTQCPNGNFAVINFFLFASPAATGSYSVTATMSHSGGLNPTQLVFTVNVQGQITTTITNASGANVLCPSSSATLVANATGGNPTSYRWYLNGVFTGMTSAVLNASVAGSYTVSAINTCSVEGPKSAPTVLTTGVPTQITAETCILLPGGDYQNTITLQGTNLAYQWRRNGVNISSGGDFAIVNTPTSTQLTVTNVSSHDGAVFSCIITGACGSAFSSGCVALPVELMSFIGAWTEGGVRLEWETGSEINNEGFEVQRSSDGIEFTALEFVPGAGSTEVARQYGFLDEEGASFPGRVLYYRLRQVDYDGSSNLSDAISVVVPGNGGLELLAFQTGGESLEVTLLSGGERNLRLILSDALGRVHIQTQLALPLGQTRLTIPSTQNLPPGVYYLYLSDGQVRRSWPVYR